MRLKKLILKPCTFCKNSSIKTKITETRKYYNQCGDCEFPSPIGITRELANKYWNETEEELENRWQEYIKQKNFNI